MYQEIRLSQPGGQYISENNAKLTKKLIFYNFNNKFDNISSYYTVLMKVNHSKLTPRQTALKSDQQNHVKSVFTLRNLDTETKREEAPCNYTASNAQDSLLLYKRTQYWKKPKELSTERMKIDCGVRGNHSSSLKYLLMQTISSTIRLERPLPFFSL